MLFLTSLAIGADVPQGSIIVPLLHLYISLDNLTYLHGVHYHLLTATSKSIHPRNL